MADNYLERRQEELAQQKKIVHRSSPSLDSLLKRNRSFRGYEPSCKVSEETLKELVSVTTLVASGMNRQPLRYRLVTANAAMVHPLVKLGAALPDEHLPHEGMEPQAYIVICSAVPEDKIVDIDLGIAGQSILLKAAEMGLGGIFILNFDKKEMRDALALPLDPIAVIAIGKPAERIFLVSAEGDNPNLTYYRKDGVHFVPKLSLSQILI